MLCQSDCEISRKNMFWAVSATKALDLYTQLEGVMYTHDREKSNSFHEASVRLCEQKERNMDNALKTFYICLYSIRHMVMDHSDSGLLYPISSKASFVCTIQQTG